MYQEIFSPLDLNETILSYVEIWTKETFLDALASLDSKLSVSQSVIDVFRLAHLRVFQSYFLKSFLGGTFLRFPKKIGH